MKKLNSVLIIITILFSGCGYIKDKATEKINEKIDRTIDENMKKIDSTIDNTMNELDSISGKTGLKLDSIKAQLDSIQKSAKQKINESIK